MELSVSPGTFLGGGDPDTELSPSPRVPGMSACRALEELCPEREVIQREVVHVADTYQPEAASVHSENVFTSRPGDGSLTDFGPSL